ncbi:SpoIIE family protein phosphatase [Dactylosporangium sp. CA-152071]|uniref:SpoIIE family protein phosphatase n=1 Tax=Dactylosporangium sp. CA-152071 TaxID=3239933 RepID=UPI003D8AD2C7
MLFFAIFDTAGHELRAGLGTTVVMSAIRAARRAGAGLDAMARAADQALEEHLAGLRSPQRSSPSSTSPVGVSAISTPAIRSRY